MGLRKNSFTGSATTLTSAPTSSTALEHCDMATATLCGITRPEDIKRSICAMGHKWMWNPKWNGLPPEEFLVAVDPLFAGIRAKLGGEYLTSDQLAGPTSRPKWAEALGLRAGIPMPCQAHSTRIGTPSVPTFAKATPSTSSALPLASSPWPARPNSFPAFAASSLAASIPATPASRLVSPPHGDIFDGIARRANTTVAALSEGLESYKAGQTGLLRLSWDNGDRTVLVNPELGGVTLGFNLVHTAQDELFAAIEGTAFHTRIILERMAEHGVRIDRVINAGGIPQKNEVLNQVYANVLNKPVLVPAGIPTSLGSGIFALLAAGSFQTIEEAQAAVCLPLRTIHTQIQNPPPSTSSSTTSTATSPQPRHPHRRPGCPPGRILPELRKNRRRSAPKKLNLRQGLRPKMPTSLVSGRDFSHAATGTKMSSVSGREFTRAATRPKNDAGFSPCAPSPPTHQAAHPRHASEPRGAICRWAPYQGSTSVTPQQAPK